MLLGVYITDLEKRSVEKDMMVLVGGKPIPQHCVKKGEEENVFEIDLVRAWKDTNGNPGWGNEVVVEVLIK